MQCAGHDSAINIRMFTWFMRDRCVCTVFTIVSVLSNELWLIICTTLQRVGLQVYVSIWRVALYDEYYLNYCKCVCVPDKSET